MLDRHIMEEKHSFNLVVGEHDVALSLNWLHSVFRHAEPHIGKCTSDFTEQTDLPIVANVLAKDLREFIPSVEHFGRFLWHRDIEVRYLEKHDPIDLDVMHLFEIRSSDARNFIQDPTTFVAATDASCPWRRRDTEGRVVFHICDSWWRYVAFGFLATTRGRLVG
jgi:hypothetical protein